METTVAIDEYTANLLETCRMALWRNDGDDIIADAIGRHLRDKYQGAARALCDEELKMGAK